MVTENVGQIFIQAITVPEQGRPGDMIHSQAHTNTS